MPEEFTIKTDIFEGPLDVLLSLIEKRKLYINDISLAAVTDDFISHIEETGEFPMSQTADFIVVASTLLLIKSKSLLPSMKLSEEEEENIENLERRLKLYRRIKELTPNIRREFGENVLYSRLPKDSVDPIFSPPEDLESSSMKEAIQRVLKSLPKKEVLKKAVVEKVMSLEEMIEQLTDRMSKNLQMSFKEFSNTDKAKRVEVIVSFLAMLELAKQGIIKVAQEGHFSDILMESEQVDIPRY